MPWWQYKWHFAAYQIILSTDEVWFCQFALLDDAGSFRMDYFKFCTSKLLWFSLSLFSLISLSPRVMDIADIILFVASNKRICGEWNDLPSETEFKLISYCYSPLDKQNQEVSLHHFQSTLHYFKGGATQWCIAVSHNRWCLGFHFYFCLVP